MEWYFQLLNPFVFVLFAIGFLIIYRISKTPAPIVMMGSYAIGTLAFLSDLIFANSDNDMLRIGVAGLYALTAIMFSAGLHIHYKKKAPWQLLFVLGAIHIGIYAGLYVSDMKWVRSFSANFGCGVLFTVGLLAFKGHLSRPLDRILSGLHLLNCLQCFVRPVIVALIAGNEINNTTHSETLFLLSLHFFVGTAAVATGMVLVLLFVREIFEDLKSRSITDVLTGLLNRRGFEAHVAPLFEAADNKPISLILIDIDHFKLVNDLHGHGVGDDVLRELGELISRYKSTDGVAGRIGGEEFALVLPRTHLSEAVGIASSLQKAFEASLFTRGGLNLSCTASFGVAHTLQAESLETAMMHADKCLYLAKHTGRNRVCSEADLAISELKEIGRKGPKAMERAEAKRKAS